MLEQMIISGAINSLVYALLALGFTLIYGVSGIINLAHGGFILIGAYSYGGLNTYFSSFFPADFSYAVPVLALIVASVLTGVIGSIFYRLTLHQIIGDEIALLVVSVCACIIFQQIIWFVFGPTLSLIFTLPKILEGSSIVAGVNIVNAQVVAAVLSVMFFVSLWIFIAKTKVGKAMKALSQDLEASMLVGVSVEKIYMLTAGISAVIACIAGVFYGSAYQPSVNNTPGTWLVTMAISFSVVVLGGLGSIKGTIIGAIIFGYAFQIFSSYFSQAGEMIASFPFIIMIIVLIIRPKGLFGKRIEME